MRLTLERRRWFWAYAFMLIPIIFFLSIRIGPTFYAFWMSLHKWDPIALDRPYLREWDSFITRDEIMESAREYELFLNEE